MKKNGKRIIVCMTICAILSGCSAQKTQTDSANTNEATNDQFKVTTITEVFGVMLYK